MAQHREEQEAIDEHYAQVKCQKYLSICATERTLTSLESVSRLVRLTVSCVGTEMSNIFRKKLKAGPCHHKPPWPNLCLSSMFIIYFISVKIFYHT
jgi:hypothetical protein